MQDLLLSAKGIGCFFYRKKGWLRREKFWALRDISFELRRGESLAVIGRNGAGKSTLLQILAGIIVPDCGTIQQADVRATLLSLNAGLQLNLTGRVNALASGMLLGVRRRDMQEKLEEIRIFSELEDFFDQPVRTYSSGMKARLGFSAAYHIDPDLMLIDEIMGVGDRGFKQKSTEVLRQRIQSHRTVVMVTHSMPLVREICDRVLWIEHGTVRAVGPVDAVVGEYESTPA